MFWEPTLVPERRQREESGVQRGLAEKWRIPEDPLVESDLRTSPFFSLILLSRKRAYRCIWGRGKGLRDSWDLSLKSSWQICHSPENSKDVIEHFKSISANPINFQNNLCASSLYRSYITSAALNPIFYSSRLPARASATPRADKFRVGGLHWRAEVLHARITSADFIP